MDQIPLYQFHRPDPAVPLEDSIIALVALKDEGKIRHIGLSSVNEDQLLAQALTPIVSIQNRYNPATAHRTRSSTCACKSTWPFCPGRQSRTSINPPPVTRIAERHGATAYRVALAWLLARSETMLTIPGTGSVHLEENVAAAGLRLDREEIAALNDLA